MAHERTHTGSELDEKGVVQRISTQISYESSVRIGVKREDDGNVQLTIGRAEPVGAFSGLDAAVALTKAEARHIAELLSPLVPENVHQGATAFQRLGINGVREGVLEDLHKTKSVAPPACLWQPIKTAPKDGTVFFAWHDVWDFPVACCWQRPSSKYDDDGSHPGAMSRWVYADWHMHSVDLGGVEITHWMPLPDLPDELDEGA